MEQSLEAEGFTTEREWHYEIIENALLNIENGEYRDILELWRG